MNSKSIDDSVMKNVKVTAADREGLLFEWLNELIYLFDRYNLVLNRFDFIRLSDTELEATVYGEKVNPTKHDIKRGVKAATYHMLQIESNNGFKAQVLVDI